MTNPVQRPTRRRAIGIFAAATAGAFVGGPAHSAIDYAWHGTAMGADATILFNGIDRDSARSAIELVVAEIDRLENALSLFRQESELCRLNRDGRLHSPGADLRRALTLAIDTAAASGGLFDPTVQPLWEAHADWFAATPDAGTPPEELVARARLSVDWRQVAFDRDSIRLGDGQRLTLNGLGQGYVTDRIAGLLAARGLKHVLVDLGEQRAVAARLDGQAWQVARPHAAPIRLLSGALATSEGAGCVLGAGGAAHHLFDPRTGRSAAGWNTVTVHHRSAAVADALSTAFYVASADEIAALLPRFPGTAAWARDRAGTDRRWIAAPADGIDLQEV